jgi:hypothetical protein
MGQWIKIHLLLGLSDHSGLRLQHSMHWYLSPST